MSVLRSCCVLLDGNLLFATHVTRNIQNVGNSTTQWKTLRIKQWSHTRKFRSNNSLTPPPLEPIPSATPLTIRTLVKPLIFTVGFSSGSLVGTSIWQYENVRAKAIERANRGWNSVRSFGEQKHGEWRKKCNQFWGELSEGQRLFAPILLANVLVFAAWRVPKFQPTMLKYFASNPAAKVICWPMFLSTFSHYSLFHIAANMFVLHSFSTIVVNGLGKEQAIALYLSGGVIASFSSFFYKVLVQRPGLSVGASGAIMAFLGYVCSEYPDIKLSIILLPMVTFSAGSAIKVIVGIDAVGCLLGWKIFDHAAHLGGALTGIVWAHYGNEYIWKKRDPILRWWHSVRESF